MVRLLLERLCVVIILAMAAFPASAATYQVNNVVVSTQASDAVKARDLALVKAQRLAFATLVGRSEEQTAKISDNQIARLVRGFSVEGERLAARAYAAKFTIRFIPNATQMVIQANGFDLVDQAKQNLPVMAMSSATVVQTPPPQPGATPTTGTTATDIIAGQTKTTPLVIVLPVLDIGTRRTLWDEPNPWREIWQKNDYSQKGLSVRVPLGDISDITDVPDTKFLSGGRSEIANMLVRYHADLLYVIIAQKQADGVLLSLYSHDGNKLQFLRKMLIHPRPGYTFDDGVPKAMQMIVMAHNNKDTNDTPDEAKPAADELETLPVQTVPTATTSAVTPITAGSALVVTVPYQSLPQWVGVQKRLRMVQGIRQIMPLRVSPSSAQVRIVPMVSNIDDLKKNMAMQNFDLVQMPNGEMTLIDK